jgi:hypothetical protein
LRQLEPLKAVSEATSFPVSPTMILFIAFDISHGVRYGKVKRVNMSTTIPYASISS